LSRIAETALSDYNRARASEEEIERSVDTLKGDVTKTNQQQVRLRELESEAESDRAVYAAFLNRAKEVGEQQDLNDTNSRIITRAVPPTAKSSPPRSLIMAGSFILGLIGGGMIGLLREQFNSTVISARELATDFRMRVLAELSDYADAPSPVFGSESPQAEAMHRLLGVLRSRSSATSPDVTLVTSPPGSPDVRSIIALNLAGRGRARASGDKRFPSARCDAAGCWPRRRASQTHKFCRSYRPDALARGRIPAAAAGWRLRSADAGAATRCDRGYSGRVRSDRDRRRPVFD
jgi:hypothetical protein